MAIVYLAQDIKLHRAVAIKVMRAELADLLGRERFAREIEIAAGLQHPNILPLYESGTAGSLLYYVMRYVEGESLRARLEREKQLRLDDALGIAHDVADALAYAHSRGVVHRDIKPENILLSDGRALVADFGIARAITVAGGSELTTRGIAVGTPAYMSPEQGSGQDTVDGRSDVYALGCVVYEMLAGEPPFSGRTAQAIIARHQQERPPSLRVVRPTISLGVQRSIETALAKVPADRYATATEFMVALERALSGRADRARLAIRLVIGAALLAGAATVWRLILAPGPSLDANRVVVFPLVDREDQAIGEDAALMIGSALEHTDPLKWIYGWTWLTQDQRNDITRLSASAARRIARLRRAKYYIDGSVVRNRDSSTVILRLSDAQGDSLIGQQSGRGAYDRVPQLSLEAVTGLLPRILEPGRNVDVPALADRKPAAVANWLAGEREHRRSQFLAALQHYERAIAEDSNLAIAALKGAQAAGWKSRLDEAERLVDVALANEQFLSPREALLAHGLASYLQGSADTAVTWLSRAISADPDWSEARMALGEVYYHLLPDTAPLDSLAENEFRRAAALDSDFTPPVFHLAEIALRRGDVATGTRLMERLQRSDPDQSMLRQLQLMLACVRAGPNPSEWEAAGKTDPEVTLQAARALSAGGRQGVCGTAGYKAVLANPAARSLQWGTFLGLHDMLAAQGRSREIVSLVDSMRQVGLDVANVVYLIDGLAGVPHLAAKADGVVSWLRDLYGARYLDSISASTQLLLGTWFARTDRVDLADLLHARLVSAAANGHDPQVQEYAAALAAHLALARGDSAAALSTLERVRPVARRATLEWGLAESFPAERLERAEVLLARGRYQEAFDVASAFDQPTPIAYLPFLGPSLVVRYRAALAARLPQRAALLRERLVSLGRDDLLGAFQ
jgi:tetratricopeptide (TPR) repeat protein